MLNIPFFYAVTQKNLSQKNHSDAEKPGTSESLY